MRIVSLLPSATEIVCALGLEKSLVGRSHECDYPSFVRALPPCTSSKINSSLSSLQIHEQTQTLLEESKSLYEIDVPLLQNLNPNVIVTQAQCEVCAVSPAEVKKALDRWTGKKPLVVMLEAMNLEGLWKDLLSVGQAVGLKEEALTLVRRLQGRLKTVNDRIQSVTRQPSLVCLEWFSPLMFGGNWIPELVELAGGKNVVGRAGEHSGWMSWEDLLKADPDFLALIPCGMDLKRTEQEAKILSENPIWRKLKAVQSGHVFAVDANQYFNRPGPRLVDSCEILAEMLYPDLFSQEYQGKAFKPFQS